MMFWNKVEIYCGLSQKEFTELRNALIEAGIHYDFKLIQLNKNRSSIGPWGQPPSNNTQYYLYVHQKDYYNALHLTSNRKIN